MHPYHNLSGLNQYSAGVFSASPPHGSLPLANSPPPPSPELYDPISPPLSGSDTSGDGLYHHSNSSGANSPSSSRGHSLVHRSHRYNPTPSPTSSSSRRRSRSHDSDDDDDVMGIAADQNLAYSRKEATRRQRIEAEQRRRDELREGYAKLKDALPVSNQKSSKVSLLERGTDRPSSAFYHFSSFLIQLPITLSCWSKKKRSLSTNWSPLRKKPRDFASSTRRSPSVPKALLLPTMQWVE